MRKVLVGFIFTLVLLSSFSLITYAGATEEGFYFGFDFGEASLYNDLYIYSSVNNERQPMLNIRESNKWEGPVYSVYAGYNIFSKEIEILNQKPILIFGVQGGYTDLGKYTNTVRWNDGLDTDTETVGYRTVKENSVDLLLTAKLLWENGFNISGKFGVAGLRGSYKQENLPSARQLEITISGQADYLVFHPELALEVGYLLSDQFNIYLKYNTIMGDTPDNGNDRFESFERIEMPNTLYKADSLTFGVTMYLF